MFQCALQLLGAVVSLLGHCAQLDVLNNLDYNGISGGEEEKFQHLQHAQESRPGLQKKIYKHNNHVKYHL